MSRQENEKNPQPKAEKTDNAAPLESRIHLLTIIGEVEGHESLGDRTKSTKYEEILPRLALIEDDDQIEGILILLHTVGGDVEAGLAIAEMIASLSKPYRSFLAADIRSVCRSPFPQITVLSCQVLPWFYIRCVPTACLSVSCKPTVIWKRHKTGSPVLSPLIQISARSAWRN